MKTLADIKKIAVLGAGTMGPGIAQTYAMGGYEVTMWTRSESTREKALAALKAQLDTFEAEGMRTESKDAILGRISFALTVEECVKGADFIQETIVENRDAKTELYQQLETNREQGLKLLSLLEDAQLIGTVSRKAKAIKHLNSPDKMFLDNPDMLYALSGQVEIGTVRETFFRRQLASTAELSLPEKGDFIVNDKYLFEVGGPKKTFEQIKDLPGSFIAADGLETGHGNKIPLWLFGFLY